MNIKKIWMPPDTMKKNGCSFRQSVSILGIVCLIFLIICSGMLISQYAGVYGRVVSIIFYLGSIAAAVWLSLYRGWRSVRDRTCFFLTEDDRLYIVNNGPLSGRNQGIPGYMESDRYFHEAAEYPAVPGGADEIIKVERIKENSLYYSIICQVRHPNRRIVRHTHFLVKGYADEDLLLYQLERRKKQEGMQLPGDRKSFLCLVTSILAFIIFTSLCVLSHPAQELLPGEIYFPCLAGDLAAFYFIVYFSIRRRRGE